MPHTWASLLLWDHVLSGCRLPPHDVHWVLPTCCLHATCMPPACRMRAARVICAVRKFLQYFLTASGAAQSPYPLCCPPWHCRPGWPPSRVAFSGTLCSGSCSVGATLPTCLALHFLLLPCTLPGLGSGFSELWTLCPAALVSSLLLEHSVLSVIVP